MVNIINQRIHFRHLTSRFQEEEPNNRPLICSNCGDAPDHKYDKDYCYITHYFCSEWCQLDFECDFYDEKSDVSPWQKLLSVSPWQKLLSVSQAQKLLSVSQAQKHSLCRLLFSLIFQTLFVCLPLVFLYFRRSDSFTL